MKRCAGPLCDGELRPLSPFGPRGRGLQSYCRSCNNTYRRHRMTTIPIVELEPDLEYDRREAASVEHEEQPRKRRRPDYLRHPVRDGARLWEREPQRDDARALRPEDRPLLGCRREGSKPVTVYAFHGEGPRRISRMRSYRTRGPREPCWVPEHKRPGARVVLCQLWSRSRSHRAGSAEIFKAWHHPSIELSI